MTSKRTKLILSAIAALAVTFFVPGCTCEHQRIMHVKNPRDVNRDNPIAEQFTRKRCSN